MLYEQFSTIRIYTRSFQTEGHKKLMRSKYIYMLKNTDATLKVN